MSDTGDLQQGGSGAVEEQEGAAEDPTTSPGSEASSPATQGYDALMYLAFELLKK